MILRILLTLVDFELKKVEEHDGLCHADLTRVVAATVGGLLVL